MDFKRKTIEKLSWFLRTALASTIVRAVFRKPAFVITQCGSQLGNQLTIFAHVIACALENEREVWNPSIFRYAQYFEHLSKDVLTRFPERKTWFSRNASLRKFLYVFFAKMVRLLMIDPNPPIMDISLVTDYASKQALESEEFLKQTTRKRFVLIEGYFFRISGDYLKKHAVRIREFLKPLPLYINNAENLINRERKQHDIIVGLHLRQFDPVYDGIHPLYQYQHVDQMTSAMARFQSLFPDKKIGFILFSNKKIDLQKFEGFSVKESTGHIAEDIHALSLCDYILASTYSTYSRWASFYGEVPLYQVNDPQQLFSLNDFYIQLPGFYDPQNEACEVVV